MLVLYVVVTTFHIGVNPVKLLLFYLALRIVIGKVVGLNLSMVVKILAVHLTHVALLMNLSVKVVRNVCSDLWAV